MPMFRPTLFKQVLAIGAFVALALPAAAQTPSTLEVVKKRGQVICGVNVGLGGFSLPDSQGKWKGLDVDMCGAVAAAVLGDASKTKFVPLSAQQRFLALQSDCGSRNQIALFKLYPCDCGVRFLSKEQE